MSTAADKFLGVSLVSMSVAAGVFVVGLITSGAWGSLPWFAWPFVCVGAGLGVAAGVLIGVWSLRGGFSR